MLDMGFLPPIKRILSNLPRKRQSMLFSATFADELNLAHAHIESNGNAKIVFLDLALKLTRLISR
jgi:superfamily II DNA/RNA helicase